MLQTLLNTPKIIKHIQRGYSNTYNFTGSTPNIANIELAGFTNVDKMIVIISGTNMNSGDKSDYQPFLHTLTTTLLTLASNTKASFNNWWGFSYQVIEFA